MDTAAAQVVNQVESLAVPDGVRTPCLLVDHEIIEKNFIGLSERLPAGSGIRFSVSTNPAPMVLRTLARLGAEFDVASSGEAELLRSMGTDPSHVRHGGAFRTRQDVEGCAAAGVTSWTVGSSDEVLKLGGVGAVDHLSVALTSRSSSARVNEAPLGVHLEHLPAVVAVGESLGVSSIGLEVDLSRDRGYELDVAGVASLLNLAGALIPNRDAPLSVVLRGFPAPSFATEDELAYSAACIERLMGTLTFDCALAMSADVFLVAEAGTLVSEVISIATSGGQRWVFLDVEPFEWQAGLVERAIPKVRATAFDLPGEAEAPATLAALGPTGPKEILSQISLPNSVVPGTLIGIPGAGAALARTHRVLDVRPAQHAGEPHGERIDLRDRDLYRAAWPGSPLFAKCRDLEQLWFEMSGFVEADGLRGFHEYDAASTFLAVGGVDGDIVSTMRLIWESPLGFKTLNDLALSVEGQELVDSVAKKCVAEVGTISTHPAARGSGPTFRMFFALNDMLARRGVTHFISAIDDGLLEIMRSAPLHFPMLDIGPSTYYYGAPSTPVIMDVPAYRQQLLENDLVLYHQLIEGRFGALAN